MQLNFLTFNTLGTPIFAPDIRKRYKKTAELINNSDIHVVCFQEVFTYYNKYWFDHDLTNFPYRVYKTFPLGVYGGLAIYSKIPIEFEDYYTYVYPKKLHIPFYTSLARSGILLAKFKDMPLRLATTHLSSDVVHNLTPQNRFYELIHVQLEQAAEMFNSLSKKSDVLLAGDFNISNDSPLYNEFLEKTKAQDLFKGDTRPSYANDRIPYIYPARSSNRIDYIFYKGKKHLEQKRKQLMFGEKVDSSDGKPFYLSDHTGLLTSITY